VRDMPLTKKQHRGNVQHWNRARRQATDRLDQALQAAREDGISFSELGRWMGQSNGAVRARAKRNGWVDKR
jgi:hypothetical protein